MPSDRPVEHTLLVTDDAMVWAEEFCRIFKGWTIVPQANATVSGVPTPHGIVDEGGMVAWFANAMQVAVNQYERRKLHEKGELTETEQFLQRWDMDHPHGDDDGDPTGEIDMSEVLVLDPEDDSGHSDNPDDEVEEAITLEEQFLEGFRDGRPA